jgi:hypothetical protein
MAPCVYFTLKQRIFSLYSRINMLDQRIGHNGIGDSNMPNEPTQIKSAGNKNALVHGLYAKDVLLPWDSREEFERLHADLKAEFFPSGRAEEEAVLELAFLHWHRRTMWRLWQSEILRDPFTDDIVQTERKSWSGIRASLRKAARGEGTVRNGVDNILEDMVASAAHLGSKIESSENGAERKELTTQLDAILQIINERVVPITEAMAKVPTAEGAFDKAHAPERLGKIMDLEAKIDVRISKALARLVGLKEFKRTPAGGGEKGALVQN